MVTFSSACSTLCSSSSFCCSRESAVDCACHRNRHRRVTKRCLCHCLFNGLYRSHGYRRLHSGRYAGRLFHSGREIRPGFYYCSNYDLFHGKRLRFFRHYQPVTRWFYSDLLRGRQPRLGQKIPCCQYAPGGHPCRTDGISSPADLDLFLITQNSHESQTHQQL